MDSIFSKELLIQALQTKYETISLWAAYQLLTIYQNDLNDELHLFLESPYLDIQEAGIAKAAEIENHSFSPRLMRFFKEKQGILKQSAALAVAKQPNDIINQLLQRWFDSVIEEENGGTISDISSATHALLESDPSQKLDYVLQKIQENIDKIVPSNILFSSTIPFCNDENSFNELMSLYFQLRGIHSDSELTQELIRVTDQVDILELISQKIDEGVSFQKFFQLCYELFRVSMPLEVFQLLEKLDVEVDEKVDEHAFNLKKVEQITEILLQWITLLPHKEYSSENDLKLKWILENVQKHAGEFSNTIPKIIEYEASFILSIPLIILVNRLVCVWLEKPLEFSEQIASYYQSTVLTIKNREQILATFFPEAPTFSLDDLKISIENPKIIEGMEQRDILWSLYKGDLLHHEIPWANIFTDPDQSIHLLEILKNYYLSNFNYYIEKQDKLSIDYALLLFQSYPLKDVTECVVHQFDYLYQHNTDVLYQTIEYIPSTLFVPLLEKYFKSDEIEIAELITYICQIHQIEIPLKVLSEVQQKNSDEESFNGNNRVRQQCPACKQSFQYLVSATYVDEETLNRENKLNMNSVWMNHSFSCKNCDTRFPFKLEEYQLEDLATQSRVNRLLKLTVHSKKNRLFQKVHLINFPRFEGKLFNPDTFAEFVGEKEKEGNFSQEQIYTMLFRLSKVFEQTEQVDKAIEALEKISDDYQQSIRKHLNLGILYFKKSNYVEARQYFHKILLKKDNESLRSSETPYAEQANYYLELMNSKTLKRKQFRLIEGKK